MQRQGFGLGQLLGRYQVFVGHGWGIGGGQADRLGQGRAPLVKPAQYQALSRHGVQVIRAARVHARNQSLKIGAAPGVEDGPARPRAVGVVDRQRQEQQNGGDDGVGCQV